MFSGYDMSSHYCSEIAAISDLNVTQEPTAIPTNVNYIREPSVFYVYLSE